MGATLSLSSGPAVGDARGRRRVFTGRGFPARVYNAVAGAHSVLTLWSIGPKDKEGKDEALGPLSHAHLSSVGKDFPLPFIELQFGENAFEPRVAVKIAQ
jgi:hypothetical protein